MSGDGTEIRPARVVDAPDMARLASELGYPASHAEMKRRLERLLTDSRHYIVVASDADGRLAGWIHVEHRSAIERGECAELMGLVVTSTVRRRGIGRQLVDLAEKWALGKGLPELRVRSNVARGDSHPFYEALGYTRRKTQHVYAKAITEDAGRD